MAEEEKKEPVEGEEPPAEDPPAEGEEGEKKEPEFKVEDYKWTVTDRKPRNLPQLYVQLKGDEAFHEVKQAESYSGSQFEAISKVLDDYMQRVVEKDLADKKGYVQILFNE